MKRYFVNFAFKRTNEAVSFSATSIDRDQPISGWDDILELTELIRNKNPDFKNIEILSWRRFEDPE
jgi:hypothetical protein